MKKILMFTLFLVFVFAGAFAQQQKDSIKKVVIDSSSAYSKLNAHQIFELEMEKVEAQRSQSQSGKDRAEVFIPVSSFLTCIIMLLIFTVFFYKLKQRRNEVFLKYAELGKDIPKEFLHEEHNNSSKLSKGIIEIGIGLGLILFLSIFMKKGIWAVGFIPLFTGTAHLIIHFIEKKQKQNDEPGR